MMKYIAVTFITLGMLSSQKTSTNYKKLHNSLSLEHRFTHTVKSHNTNDNKTENTSFKI